MSTNLEAFHYSAINTLFVFWADLAGLKLRKL